MCRIIDVVNTGGARPNMKYEVHVLQRATFGLRIEKEDDLRALVSVL